ncbi:hypothetical protein KGQ19_33910 [Catenulispora sp. NL8]|uniref:Pyrrolo-quinoline quinone n=1 Tax=Catenulispora pinistramenti TaxID=2705254 RepID=A0ABS5L0K8_9ACTN|nr:hypothetical protein [Catenulispora pinistramenti]MBS2551871.1 hypothetical protein [Catenulispora pinistramenti]
MKNVIKAAMPTAAAGLMLLSLTACGGSTAGAISKVTTAASGKGASTTASAQASGSASASASGPGSAGVTTAPQQLVPAAFDNTKGWSITPPTDGTSLDDPVIAPDTNLLLLRSSTVNDTSASIIARDAKTGAIRWSGQPAAQAASDGSSSTDINVLVTHKAGKEYAVLVSTGFLGGDAVTKASEVTQLEVFDAASSGAQVAPLRVITVPGLADGYSALRDGGTVLVQLGTGGAVVDVTTGQVTAYGDQDAVLKPPAPCELAIGDCSENAKIIGQTPAGPLVQGYAAFWTKAWISDGFIPQGTKTQFSNETVQADGTPGGQVLARWPQPTDATTDVVWALHDGQTGRVLATVPCAAKTTSASQTGSAGNDGVTLSPDGHYLIAGDGIVVFDLQGNKGYCFAANATRNEVDVTAVDTDGTAYGTVHGTATGTTDVTPASVKPDSGQATALPAGTLVPALIGAGVGVFGTSTAGGGSILVYPHH